MKIGSKKNISFVLVARIVANKVSGCGVLLASNPASSCFRKFRVEFKWTSTEVNVIYSANIH